ncbi:MAG: hypothetical protein WA347_00800 [Rhabdochlamydiaceae bacterium]|jgi:hypothetical protein
MATTIDLNTPSFTAEFLNTTIYCLHPNEKRITSLSADPNFPICALRVHLENLSAQERATGILSHVQCLFFSNEGDPEIENWKETEINIKGPLEEFTIKLRQPMLNQSTELMKNIGRTKRDLQRLFKEVQFRLETQVVGDQFPIPFSFYDADTRDKRFIGFDPKNWILHVNYNALSDTEKTTGVLKKVHCLVTSPEYSRLHFGREDWVLRDINIREHLDIFVANRNGMISEKNLCMYKSRIEELYAETKETESKVEKLIQFLYST